MLTRQLRTASPQVGDDDRAAPPWPPCQARLACAQPGHDNPGVARLSLLGPVELTDGAGHREPVGGVKQCGLLAWLALHAPGSSDIAHIIAALWGDEPSPSARNAVQVYVSRLRVTLRRHGADIEKAGDGYRLIPGVLDVDSLLFDALVAEGRSALRIGDLDRPLTGWRRPCRCGAAYPSVASSRCHIAKRRA